MKVDIVELILWIIITSLFFVLGVLYYFSKEEVPTEINDTVPLIVEE